MTFEFELKCEDCGTTENVEETACPFADEISNTRVEAILCDKCYNERAMDV